ncbi:hypothetical protein BU16DRAFT_529139 [Lophium mytilinum]|uniref:Uncharacterized protein n=1 Tax=Lophium mytilinum TaxID=390894 RepID=A0A6A6QLL4_9PEZI|nr:hypothetical protein BU16DRAFT_529139 [Lophium mytilinum]
MLLSVMLTLGPSKHLTKTPNVAQKLSEIRSQRNCTTGKPLNDCHAWKLDTTVGRSLIGGRQAGQRAAQFPLHQI